MRTTVDIPDALYEQLKMRAASEKTSIKELLLRGAKKALAAEDKLKKRRRPVQQAIKTGAPPGSLKITNAKIYELIFS